MHNEEFLEIIFQRKNTLIRTLSKKRPDLINRIIDVIFFPESGSCPMIRLDGKGMTLNAIANLESTEKYVIVRIPELSGSLSQNNFLQLSAWAKLHKKKEKNDYIYNKELYKTTKNFLKSSKNFFDTGYLWEIDCGANSITIRVIDDSVKKNTKIQLSNLICLEVYKTFKVEDAKNLLLARDLARDGHEPFFIFLKRILSDKSNKKINSKQ
jgi:hypothetical protein